VPGERSKVNFTPQAQDGPNHRGGVNGLLSGELPKESNATGQGIAQGFG
jgi:hypothetical protein